MAEPRIVGNSEILSNDGPKLPITLAPIQAPIMPTTAAVKKPPGMRPGTKDSAIQAQTAATTRNKIKPIILINNFQPHSTGELPDEVKITGDVADSQRCFGRLMTLSDSIIRFLSSFPVKLILFA